MRLGKNMEHALNFARKYSGWHTYANDATTKSAIQRLEKQGMVEVNEFNQFRGIQ